MCVEWTRLLNFLILFQKINALFIKKQKIEKEIEALQKSCKHRDKTVRQIRERVDSSSPVIRWVCGTCSKILGYPNNGEIDKFFKE